MLRIDTGICYGLNKVGTAVWQQITGPVTVAEICTALLARYDIDAETCERQVQELLGELHAEGLISIAEH
ncbi:MAG TPA: PqqD family protein [Aliidongia sp.]|nr:PqqD family protein [Aliidongia sp.]